MCVFLRFTQIYAISELSGIIGQVNPSSLDRN
jgi:hypothetical protein